MADSAMESSNKSPTSPLDFGLLANFSGLFSPKSPFYSPFQSSNRSKWNCTKVGLAIVHSLANESKPGEEDLDDSPKRENVVIGPQIKIKTLESSRNCRDELLDASSQSSSLPKNYMPSSRSGDEDLDDSPKRENLVIGPLTKIKIPETSRHYLDELLGSSSQSNSLPKNNIPELSDSDSVLGDKGLPLAPSSSIKPSSSPMDIVSGHAYSCSVTAREMTLSEDYTCIISHGPNPKTTHIFGDHILDCDPSELESFDENDEPKNPQDSPLEQSDDPSSCGYLCKEKLEEGYDDICIFRDGEAFCGFGCGFEEILAEEGNDMPLI